MKKTITLILSMLMILSVCLTGCNNGNEKSAEDLFFNNPGSELLPNLLKDMGFESINETAASDKNSKVGLSYDITKLNAGGVDIIEGPMSIKADIISSADVKTVSGSVEYTYLTDSLKALIAANADGKAYLKFDGVTEKYIDVESIMGLIGGAAPMPTAADASDSVEINANADDLEELYNAVFACFDKSKVTESKKEITVNNITTKVRAIEYNATGAEFKTLFEKIVKAVFDSKLVKDAVANSGAQIPEINFDDVKYDDNDKLSIVYYFDVNTYKGCSVEFNMPGEGIKVNAENKEATDKNGDYADLKLTITAPADETGSLTQTVTLNGTYKNEKGKFEAKLNADAGTGTTVDITLNGEVVKAEGTAKRTDMTLAIGSGGMSFSIPVTVTVNESTKDKIDFTVASTVSIPSTAVVAFSMGVKGEYTDEAPVTVAADNITTADTLDEADLTKLMGKISKTMELMQSMSGPAVPDDTLPEDGDLE